MATVKLILNKIGDEEEPKQDTGIFSCVDTGRLFHISAISAEAAGDIAINKSLDRPKSKLLVRPNPNAAYTNSRKVRDEGHHTALVDEQKRLFFKAGLEKYSLSTFWRYALRAMDIAFIVPCILNVLIGRLGIEILFEAGVVGTDSWTWLAFFLLFKFVSDVMCAPINAYFEIRDLIFPFVSESAPSEAHLLLLEWERNRKYGKKRPDSTFLRYAMLIKVIERGRLANDQGQLASTARSCAETRRAKAERITEELRELLLFGSRLPSHYSALDYDVQASESRTPAWEYHHNTWELMDLCPKSITGPVSVFICCDILVKRCYTEIFTMIMWPLQIFLLLWVCRAPEDHYQAICSNDSLIPFSEFIATMIRFFIILGAIIPLWDAYRFFVLRLIRRDPKDERCDDQSTLTIDTESNP